jgi:hypothetical protein
VVELNVEPATLPDRRAFIGGDNAMMIDGGYRHWIFAAHGR